MSTAKQIASLAVACCAALAACTSGDDTAADSPAAATAGSDTANRPAATLSLSQLAGTWNMRSVPESGADTTTTLSVIRATADTTGWTQTLPGRQPLPVRIRVSGDSLTTQTGPYESVRRRGVQVTTRGVYRLQGDSLVGVSIARYATTGADSVLRLRSVGKRAP